MVFALKLIGLVVTLAGLGRASVLGPAAVPFQFGHAPVAFAKTIPNFPVLPHFLSGPAIPPPAFAAPPFPAVPFSHIAPFPPVVSPPAFPAYPAFPALPAVSAVPTFNALPPVLPQPNIIYKHLLPAPILKTPLAFRFGAPIVKSSHHIGIGYATPVFKAAAPLGLHAHVLKSYNPLGYHQHHHHHHVSPFVKTTPHFVKSSLPSAIYAPEFSGYSHSHLSFPHTDIIG